jgi:phenylacetic acid degradation protein paaN
MQSSIQELIQANRSRAFFFKYNENPKAYAEDLAAQGLLAFQQRLNTNYNLPAEASCSQWVGEEVSPYLQTGLGIHYPQLSVDALIQQAQTAQTSWQATSIDQRFEILNHSLEIVSQRFFELAYATMHTTGQSFMMSFQASGPHACDRALEVMATAYEQLTYYPNQVNWVKPMGKFDLSLHKTYSPIPKGIGLVIGCSTFPTWNTVPGLYANLMTGNVCIVKPHPKAIYPIAIFIEALQTAMITAGVNPHSIQLAADTIEAPLSKTLAEHPAVQLIDYTGGNAFGDYVESLHKTCFTEKAGINSILLDSCKNIDAVAQNIAFAVSLYSGQMCTAPQNIYIAKQGVQTEEGLVSVTDVQQKIVMAIKGLMDNPKAAAPTLGAIQNDATISRIQQELQLHADKVLTYDTNVVNAEFESARIQTPSVIACSVEDKNIYMKECFGPMIYLVQTESFEQSLSVVQASAQSHGAITCSAYTTDAAKTTAIQVAMNAVFTPVSFNFIGAAFVNQHAAFSDLHVSGGNPAGNATFTNTDFINKRYIWIGNRYML